MKIELTPDQSFTARAGERLVHGMHITSEWEGLRKLVDGTGRHMIVDADGIVIKGTPELLHDLHLTVLADFIAVPETTLPGGFLVPAFTVARHNSSIGADGKMAVDGKAKPRVGINFRDSKQWCIDAGRKMLTLSQSLAIALNIASVAENWTGGAVGEGSIYQGIHKGNVTGPQDGSYESTDPLERRWHVLTTGERIYDFAGHIWCWLIDDMHGDEQGLVNGTIPKDVVALTCAPAKSGQKGVGYVPSGPLNWSGNALIRGGCWSSGSNAGVFYLNRDWPDNDYDYVGVRCTN